jgi:hypothetical protein
MKKNSAIGAVAAVLLATTNIADAKTPKMTRDFLIYCQEAANLHDCSAEIETSDVAINANITFGNGRGAGSCAPSQHFSDGLAVEKAAVQKLLAWIQAHPAMLSAPTSKSVDAAVKALWTCR